MESGPLNSAPLGRFHKKGRWILLFVAVAAGAWFWFARSDDAPGQLGSRSARVERVVPDSLRIRVEVLNASGIRGQARLGTFHLRDLGFDVVASGNASERVDSTLVIVRSGRMDWGELASKALGGARIAVRPDSSRYLDLTILLGSTWRPPTETFHP